MATHLSAPGYGQLAHSPWADWKDDARSFPCSWLLAYDMRQGAVARTSPFVPREGSLNPPLPARYHPA
jgi:hypothetical protein